MISLKDSQRKLVLPAWLDFSEAAKKGELSWPRTTPFNLSKRDRAQFEATAFEFQQLPTDHIASDLFGFALSIGREDVAREAAQHLLKSTGIQLAARQLAQRFLSLDDRTDLTDWRQQVHVIRKLLHSNPRNPIAWVETARAYTVLGQWDQAEHALQMALRLAPHNRYVLRSVARFYIHTDTPDVAWKIFHRSSVEFDPWLKSCEINLSILANKAPRRIPKDDAGDALQGDDFYYSELLESIGMVNLINGKDKFARRAFEFAWKDASHNVITHAEWVTRRHFPALEEKISNKFNQSWEASTYTAYFNDDLGAAAQCAEEWLFQEPYSKKSALAASYLACVRGDYVRAEEIAKRGLDSNPDDDILKNNVVFLLLKTGKVAEAEKQHPRTSPEGTVNQICHAATTGLLEFKKGNAVLGRHLYLESISLAEKHKDLRLANMARLNLAQAELEARGLDAAAEAGEIVEKVGDDKNPDVRFLRKRVEADMLALLAQPMGETTSIFSAPEPLADKPVVGGSRLSVTERLASLFRRAD